MDKQPLDTNDIIFLLSDCPLFGGVYSCDEIPVTKKRPIAFVVNTDRSNKSGEHWQVIHLRKDGVGEFFDSFGLPPDVSQISDYLDAEADGWGYLPFTVQHAFAVSCGLYCVNFIRARHAGLTYAQVIKQFSEDPNYNEEYIYNYGTGQIHSLTHLWNRRLSRLHGRKQV